MVDDYQMCGRCPVSGGPEEAHTVDADTVLRALGGEPVPRGRCVSRAEVQLAPIPVSRGGHPDKDLGEEPRFVFGKAVARPQMRPTLQTQVVGPTLEHGVFEVLYRRDVRRFQRGHQRGDILAEQLLLKVDRVGGHNDPLVVHDRVEDGGKQIGEGLAHAGTGLDDQPMALVDGRSDSPGHGYLLATLFERGHGAGEGAGLR